MKSLQQHIYENIFHKSEITERLIINKNFINANNDDIEELLSNKEENDATLENKTNQNLRYLFASGISFYTSQFNIIYHKYNGLELADKIFDNLHYLPETFSAYKFEKGIFKYNYDNHNTLVCDVFNDIINKSDWTVTKPINLLENERQADLIFTMMTSENYIIFAFHSKDKTKVYSMIIFKFLT